MIRFLLYLLLFVSCNKEIATKTNTENLSPDKPQIDMDKVSAKAVEALEFCKEEGLNTDFCILVDMSLHSGVKRMWIWDFEQDKIVGNYLVGHGCGESVWSKDFTKNNAKFSNMEGSHLSSLGKYTIGERGYSEWGIHIKYLLHGLEETNSNALKRAIVFHSWSLMSDEEVFPEGSPEGWGCPTVSNNAMKEIDEILKTAKKPVLFWVYQ